MFFAVEVTHSLKLASLRLFLPMAKKLRWISVYAFIKVRYTFMFVCSFHQLWTPQAGCLTRFGEFSVPVRFSFNFETLPICLKICQWDNTCRAVPLLCLLDHTVGKGCKVNPFGNPHLQINLIAIATTRLPPVASFGILCPRWYADLIPQFDCQNSFKLSFN